MAFHEDYTFLQQLLPQIMIEIDLRCFDPNFIFAGLRRITDAQVSQHGTAARRKHCVVVEN